MLEFVKKRFLGLDIGESAIKLIEVKKTREGYRLGKARLVELDIDPTFDSSEKRSHVIKKALKQLLAEEKIVSGVAALSISGSSVFIRPLKVPKIAKHKIEQIVQYEAQLQVPFPINEVVWNYELFEIYDSPETEIALVAVKKDIVEEKLDLLSETGLEVEFIDIDPFSLYNALFFVEGIKNRIILDIGAKDTEIIIIEEHRIWTRSILIGGNDLTKAIAANLKISFKEAEMVKRREGIVAMNEEDRTTSAQAGAISDAITPILVELLADISKSIGYFKSQFDETEIFREILITGGGSKLRNIAQFIGKNIDIPASNLNLLEKIKSDLDFELTEDLTGRMDVGIGLALRTVTPLATKTNLIPKEMAKAKEFEKKKWYIVGSLLIAFFIFITLASFVNWINGKKEIALSKSSALIERYTRFHKEITGGQSKIGDLKARIDITCDIAKGRKRTIEFFTELIRLLPDNLWLTKLEQDNNTLTITGRTKETFESISKFKDVLEGSPYFKAVRVKSANLLKDEDISLDIRVFIIEIEMLPLAES